MEKVRTEHDGARITCSILTAILPIVLLALMPHFLFSEAQISGIWVSDLFGHLCVLGCIPLTTLAIFAYRRAWMGLEFHPHIRKVSLTLLGLDSLLSVFCIVMMIGSIKMWLGV